MTGCNLYVTLTVILNCIVTKYHNEIVIQIMPTNKPKGLNVKTDQIADKHNWAEWLMGMMT